MNVVIIHSSLRLLNPPCLSLFFRNQNGWFECLGSSHWTALAVKLRLYTKENNIWCSSSIIVLDHLLLCVKRHSGEFSHRSFDMNKRRSGQHSNLENHVKVLSKTVLVDDHTKIAKGVVPVFTNRHNTNHPMTMLLLAGTVQVYHMNNNNNPT